MDHSQHAALMGSLVGNFNSLEFILRTYLTKLPSTGALGIPTNKHYYEYPVGSEIGVDPFSNFDSLGELIDKVNAHLASNGGPQIDRALVEVRDAIAHGRISAPNTASNLHLIKFDRPNRSNKVRVVFNEELSETWLSSQRRRVHDAIQIVYAHMPP
jgi:hypothetical protein